MSGLAKQAEVFLQFGQTQRYHTQALIKPQDVGQHSFNVAWFCWLLTEGRPSVDLIMSALAHDGGERLTGDMPAPTKMAVPGLGKAMDEMEREFTARAGWSAPELNPYEQRVLKFADVLDGAFYCLRELRMGNRLMVEPAAGDQPGVNYLRYLSARIASEPNTHLAILASELYNHLRNEYARLSPEQFPRFD
jgi:5'-deoxynucleotidase YfbR-like HD superfamily hydrolase